MRHVALDEDQTSAAVGELVLSGLDVSSAPGVGGLQRAGSRVCEIAALVVDERHQVKAARRFRVHPPAPRFLRYPRQLRLELLGPAEPLIRVDLHRQERQTKADRNLGPKTVDVLDATGGEPARVRIGEKTQA